MYPLPLLLLVLQANAIRVPLEPRRLERNVLLNRRAELSGSVFGTSPISNLQDVTYSANITIGGQQRSVLIDTGSADLWTTGIVDKSVDTGLPASLTYAKGDASGHINTAEVSFAGYTVSNQAYINVTSGKDLPSGGILGLGPYTNSRVHATMKTADGDPFVNRVFAQNTSTPNYISFTLSRIEDPTTPFPAELTIGELISGLESVTSTPKLPVQILPIAETGSQHWSLNVDSVTGPDGTIVNYTTTVPGETSAVAFLDTGFSLPQVPYQISNAFYGRIQGAVFNQDASVGPAWVIPCDQPIMNVSFKIGGVDIPIHPLDMSLQYTETDGSITCYGAFQPNTITFANADQQFDMCLGMAFLRNTYTLIDFGDFVDAKAQETEDPFIQLLPLTKPDEGKSDFIKARLGGVDTTSDPKFALLPPDQAKSSPPTPGGSRVDLSKTKQVDDSTADKIKHILIIVAAVVGGLVILGCLLCLLGCFGVCSCLRRSKRGNVGFRGVDMRQSQAYRPLHDPVPQGHAPNGSYGYHGTFA